jgi:C4-type Zn-finger protein
MPGAPPALEPPLTAIECPLCYQRSGHLSGGCASCPMGGSCSSLTCSRCGYRFVPEVRWQARLERWGGWARRRLGGWI